MNGMEWHGMAWHRIELYMQMPNTYQKKNKTKHKKLKLIIDRMI